MENVINETVFSLLDKIYPIGSIYINISNVDPNALLGGEWKKIQNCFLYAQSDSYTIGSTGGEATHVLTTSEMPGHTHNICDQETTDSNAFLAPLDHAWYAQTTSRAAKGSRFWWGET